MSLSLLWLFLTIYLLIGTHASNMRLRGSPPLGDPSFNTLLFAGTVRAQRTVPHSAGSSEDRRRERQRAQTVFLILSMSFKSDFPSSSYLFS